jgi:DNA mismatch repair protein MutS2
MAAGLTATRRGSTPAGPGGGLEAIEYARVLEQVAREASSEPGADRIRATAPLTEPDSVREALASTDEMVGLLLADSAWAPPPIPRADPALRRSRVAGSSLEPEELRSIAVLLASSGRCRRDLRRGSSDEQPRLATLGARMLARPELQVRLETAFDDSGAVADAASPELRRIRSDLRSSRRALVSRLERFLGTLTDRVRVSDASVTVRSGRYCVPVRREGRSEVGGIIHDESATHQTLFVEPPVAIQPMNRIRELELEEAREVRRILRDLTDRVRPHAAELSTSLAVLTEVDALFAKARYALRHGGIRPEMLDPAEGVEYHVVAGRHPLLLAGEEPVVPFDLTVGPDERVVLVSGPNAGGKTVLLKAVGLISALAQSGITPPVGPGTRLPVFRRLFAVVGDEQSIDASLSTFSGHVAHLKSILEVADAESLVLIDEVGANTDPAEGAALAAAVLLELAGRARLTVATTHLGELKELAEEDPGVVNASLRFDAAALRPSFMLTRDRPGRSYALEIAQRLGMPAAVLEAARTRLSNEARAVEDLLAKLERRERELAEMAGRTAAEERATRELREELATRLDDVEARERELEREGRQAVERYLLAARKDVEAAIARLRDEYAELAAGRTAEATGAAASRARAAVEDSLRRARQGHSAPAEVRDLGEGEDGISIEVGDTVALRSMRAEARVVELRGTRVIVETGGVRLTVPRSDVLSATAPTDADRAASARSISSSSGIEPPGIRPLIEPTTEIDLRGLRAEEVEGVLIPAIDAAVVGALPRLTVIHGKGTGVLRRTVDELAREDARVTSSRIGTPQEGGSGVTIIELGNA